MSTEQDSKISEEQIRALKKQFGEQFDKAYIARVVQAVEKKETDYIVSLIGEIGNRICSLTPTRTDLHQSLLSQVDLVLIKQMIEHDAFGPTEFYQVMDSFMSRMEMLCAPADQKHIDVLRTRVNTLDGTLSWGETVAPFFLEFNRFIDLIEQRIAAVRADPTMMALIRRKKELEASKKN
jgi:hypothetical protein